MINVSPHRSVPAGAARVPQQLADGLFTALGRGAVDAAELAVAGGGADPAVPQALAVEAGAGVPAQVSLDRLLWEGDDSSWQDGGGPWPS